MENEERALRRPHPSSRGGREASESAPPPSHGGRGASAGDWRETTPVEPSRWPALLCCVHSLALASRNGVVQLSCAETSGNSCQMSTLEIVIDVKGRTRAVMKGSFSEINSAGNRRPAAMAMGREVCKRAKPSTLNLTYWAGPSHEFCSLRMLSSDVK